jgi:signal transduction histidine kinase
VFCTAGGREDEVTPMDGEPLRLVNEKLVQRISELEAANDDRRVLVGQLITAHEDERRSIAESIHDDSIQGVLAISMHLDSLIQNGGGRQAQLEELREMAAQAVAGLRRLLVDLHPVDIQHQGLAQAVAIHLEQARDEDGLAFDLDNALERQPPEPVRTVLYRAAREAVANVRKHAGACRIDVVLKERDGGFAVMVCDDGTGFAPDQALRVRPGHLGLPALRDRVEMAGGSLTLDSRPGTGSLVEVWLPHPETA